MCVQSLNCGECTPSSCCVGTSRLEKYTIQRLPQHVRTRCTGKLPDRRNHVLGGSIDVFCLVITILRRIELSNQRWHHQFESYGIDERTRSVVATCCTYQDQDLSLKILKYGNTRILNLTLRLDAVCLRLFFPLCGSSSKTTTLLR